jgi:hypothetical protein
MSGERHAQVSEMWLGEPSYQTSQKQQHLIPDQTTLSILDAHIFPLVKAEYARIHSRISDHMKTAPAPDGQGALA